MRHRLAGVLVLLFSATLFPAPMAAQGEPDPAKVRVIRELLQVTRVAEQALAVMERAVENQRGINREVPAEFWDRFLLRARERSGELLDVLVPAYDQAFTMDDLNGLLAFYRSPLGIRLLDAQPGLVQASMQAGERWGATVGTDVAEELAQEDDPS